MKFWKWFFILILVTMLLCVQNIYAKSMSNADFNGRYIVGGILMDSEDGFETDVLQFDANGARGISFEILHTSENDENGNLLYTIDPDGRMTITAETVDSLGGALSGDGRYFTLTKILAGEEPVFMFGIRESTGMSVADLTGEYQMYGFLHEDDELQSGETGTMIFNGSGNWQWHDDANDGGPYTVTSKGHLTMADHNGMVSDDGNVFFIVSTDDADDVLEIIIGIRLSSGMSSADFMGDYYETKFGSDDPKNCADVVDYFRTVTVGTGNNVSSQEIANSAGWPRESGTATITTNSNGTFSFFNGAVKGSLASDGSVYAITGSIDGYINLGIGITASSGTNTIDNDGDGFTINQGDCDDEDMTIYPGAIEICGDGIDQDCNGKDQACIDTAPSAPTGVTASDATLSGKVQVSWTSATGATSYDVYRAYMPAWTGTAPKRIASSVSGTSYNDTSAVSGSRYYYWVKSRNSGGVSKYSNFDAGYWGNPGSIPAVPTNVSATDGTVPGKVNITWGATANSLIYEIWRADIPAFLGGKMKKIGTSVTTSYSDATVINGNRYYYWVKARNSWGVSRYSIFDTGYIGIGSSPLSAPTGVSATDGSVSGKVSITWNTVSGSMVYEVWRAGDLVSAGGKPVRVGFTSSTTLSDSSGSIGTTYYYWVKSRDSWGASKYSVPDTGYRN